MSRATPLLSAALALLLAGPAAARDAKPADLADLRDAVKAAAKKGNNVGEIAKAVDAVGQLLAKGWAAPKPGDAPPPELAALRDAVEAAARKGENVDGIRTELEAVEKALVGRTLTAAKPEVTPLGEPKVEPDLPRFGRGGVIVRGGGVVIGGGRRVVIGGGDAGFRSVTISNDAFTIKASQGGIEYVISGRLADDDADAVKVVITDGEKKVEAESLKKVPEQYREGVDKLLKSIRR
ncbi:MAG: hypothetical protein C0501_10645 [Isosphaera sp.]|nr:hypothetical protein [Isosphaera sp.]